MFYMWVRLVWASRKWGNVAMGVRINSFRDKKYDCRDYCGNKQVDCADNFGVFSFRHNGIRARNYGA